MTDWLHPNRLFTRRELWYHLLMMPVLFPVGNYLFLGERYFTDAAVFGWGTGLVFALYWFSLFVLTAAVKGVFQRFPNVRQARQRTLLALLVATTLTVGLATFDVWIYSLVPLFRQPFAWETVQAIGLLGLAFDLLLCFVLGIQYTYSRWQENQTEKEQLKGLVVQQRLDALKQQLNPHFLFNALNSVSSLIAEDPLQAEEFVNELAKVYRYLLQANQRERVSLAEEVQFIRSYTQLLVIRYGESLRLRIAVDVAYESASIPPLTLQMLTDDIVQHHILKPDKPLHITIETTPDGRLRVGYNRQPRTIRMDTGLPGFADVINRYRASGLPAPVLEDGPDVTSIWLPLLV